MNRLLKQIIFYSVLVGLWQSLASLKLWPRHLFPTPYGVFQSLRAGFSDHAFYIGIAVSMERVLLGYVLSAILGIALAVLLTYNEFLHETVGRLAIGLQSMPSVCWLPLALLWFGISEKAILFVVVIGSVLSISMALEAGLRSVPEIYAMAGRNLGARGIQLFLCVLLPASLPHLVSGLKQGWIFAWRGLLAGEMLFASLGLGQLLMMGRNSNDVRQVIAVMILVIGIGYAVDAFVFRAVERSLRRTWGLSQVP